MATTHEVPNQCAGPFGAAYSFWIERERLARLVGRALWGIDVRPMYRAMAMIGEQADGSTIVDVPCGNGVALRGLRPRQDVRYLAIDLDGAMLERTRRRAVGLPQVDVLQADMRDLPVASETADLACCFSGLHMITRPDDAVGELSRILRPGGSLVGTTFLRGGSRRQQRLFAMEQRRLAIPPPFTGDDLRGWLEAAGMSDVAVTGTGFGLFRASKPNTDRTA